MIVIAAIAVATTRNLAVVAIVLLSYCDSGSCSYRVVDRGRMAVGASMADIIPGSGILLAGVALGV